MIPDAADELKDKAKIVSIDNLISVVGKLIYVSIIGLVIVLVSGNVKDIAVAWSGKETTAKIDVDVGANAQLSLNGLEKKEATGNNLPTTLAFWVGTGGFAVGLFGLHLARRQRKLRQVTVEHLFPYKEMYERQIDNYRSSSGLLPNGETRPEDN